MSTTFKGVKIGDRVWSIEYGWGQAVKVFENGFMVHFGINSRNADIYSFNGHRHADTDEEYLCPNQTLFWDEILIVAPEKPKKIVKKTVDCAFTVFNNILNPEFVSVKTHAIFLPANAKNCSFTCEYEVEE